MFGGYAIGIVIGLLIVAQIVLIVVAGLRRRERRRRQVVDVLTAFATLHEPHLWGSHGRVRGRWADREIAITMHRENGRRLVTAVLQLRGGTIPVVRFVPRPDLLHFDDEARPFGDYFRVRADRPETVMDWFAADERLPLKITAAWRFLLADNEGIHPAMETAVENGRIRLTTIGATLTVDRLEAAVNLLHRLADTVSEQALKGDTQS